MSPSTLLRALLNVPKYIGSWGAGAGAGTGSGAGAAGTGARWQQRQVLSSSSSCRGPSSSCYGPSSCHRRAAAAQKLVPAADTAAEGMLVGVGRPGIDRAAVVGIRRFGAKAGCRILG